MHFFFEGPGGLEIPTIQLRSTSKPSFLKPFEEHSGRLKVGEQIRRITMAAWSPKAGFQTQSLLSKHGFVDVLDSNPGFRNLILWLFCLSFYGLGLDLRALDHKKKVERVLVRIHWRRPGRTFRSYAFVMHVYCFFAVVL